MPALPLAHRTGYDSLRRVAGAACVTTRRGPLGSRFSGPRGYSVETDRGDAVAATWIFRGRRRSGSRRPKGARRVAPWLCRVLTTRLAGGGGPYHPPQPPGQTLGLVPCTARGIPLERDSRGRSGSAEFDLTKGRHMSRRRNNLVLERPPPRRGRLAFRLLDGRDRVVHGRGPLCLERVSLHLHRP